MDSDFGPTHNLKDFKKRARAKGVSTQPMDIQAEKDPHGRPTRSSSVNSSLNFCLKFILYSLSRCF